MEKSDLKIFHNSSATLIWGIIFIAAAVFLASSISLIFRTYHGQPQTVRTYPYFEDIDSIVNSDIAPYSDMFPDYRLIQELWKNQQCINSQRDNLLADVRQETNNSIEKISAELNFWVAIIAILGVLVPVAITFKGERESKEWMSKMDSLYEGKMNNHVDRLNQKITAWEEKIEDIKTSLGISRAELETWHREKDAQWEKAKSDLLVWQESRSKELEIKFNDYTQRFESFLDNMRCDWNDIRRDIDANRESADRIRQELNLQMSTSSLASVRNNRILESESELRTAYNHMAHHTIMDYFRLFDRLTHNNDALINEDTRWDLIRISMQFYEILQNLTLSHTEPVRPRYLYLGQEAVQDLISLLMQNFPQPDAIASQFEIVRQRTEIILQHTLS